MSWQSNNFNLNGPQRGGGPSDFWSTAGFSFSSRSFTRASEKKEPPVDWRALPTWVDTWEKLKAAAAGEGDQADEKEDAPAPAAADKSAGKKSSLQESKDDRQKANQAARDAEDADDEDLQRALAMSKAIAQPSSDSGGDSPRAQAEGQAAGEVTTSDQETSVSRADSSMVIHDDEDDESAAEEENGQEEEWPEYEINPELNAKIKLYRGDITRLNTDAVVNAANTGLWGGGGICGAIFSAACDWKLTKACKAIVKQTGKCPTGQTRLTRGFELPAKYILHTVGPMNEDPKALVAAYQSAYDTAVNPFLLDQKHGEEISIRSLAMCCISTGIYGFDNYAAAFHALKTTREWLEADPERAKKIDCIVLCVFLAKDLAIYEEMLPTFFPVEPDEDDEDEADGQADGEQKEADTAMVDDTAAAASAGPKKAKREASPAGRPRSAKAKASATGATSNTPPLSSPEFKKRKSSEMSDDTKPAAAAAAATRPAAASSAAPAAAVDGNQAISPQRQKMLDRQAATRAREEAERAEEAAEDNKKKQKMANAEVIN